MEGGSVRRPRSHGKTGPAQPRPSPPVQGSRSIRGIYTTIRESSELNLPPNSGDITSTGGTFCPHPRAVSFLVTKCRGGSSFGRGVGHPSARLTYKSNPRGWAASTKLASRGGSFVVAVRSRDIRGLNAPPPIGLTSASSTCEKNTGGDYFPNEHWPPVLRLEGAALRI